MPFVPASTFLYADEAHFAQGLLRSAGVLCYLENEHTLHKVWIWNVALGGLRLMVPESVLSEVRKILTEQVSEEALTAETLTESELDGPGPARNTRAARVLLLLSFFILGVPNVDRLSIFYVGR